MEKTSETPTMLKIGFKNYQELYLNWVNDFITVQGFADYHNIDYKVADRLINDAVYLYGMGVRN